MPKKHYWDSLAKENCGDLQQKRSNRVTNKKKKQWLGHTLRKNVNKIIMRVLFA